MTSEQAEKNTEKALQVRLFGDFEISDGTVSLTQDDIRSDMVTKLFAYLLMHRGRSCTVQELSDALWPEESSDNPAGALKNLMYRLRKTVEKRWPGNHFFLTGRGSYQWNPDIAVLVDAEEMERLIEEASEDKNDERRIGHLLRAVDLYRGKLLADYANEYWVMSEQALAQSRYLKAVHTLAGLLAQKGRFDVMEEVCLKAVSVDPLDESLHGLLMRAYIGENKQKAARDHYRETVRILYDSLGVEPSEELRGIYSETMKQMHSQEADLEAIQADLREQQKEKGAFYCEYGVFKKIYELEVRRVNRIGMSIFLALITLHIEQKPKAGRTELDIGGEAMDQMQKILMACLRQGDLVTRYSKNQFLVMLQGCNYENAKVVMNRINSNYYGLSRHVKAGIQYSLKEMEI